MLNSHDILNKFYIFSCIGVKIVEANIGHDRILPKYSCLVNDYVIAGPVFRISSIKLDVYMADQTRGLVR